MIKEANITRVKCPACGYRLFDKGDQACGPVQRSVEDVSRFGKLNLRQINSNR